jgi:hypothetical protein
MSKALDKVRRQHAELLQMPNHPAWCVAHGAASRAIEEMCKLARNESWQTRKAINCCAAYLKRSDKLFTKIG